MTKCSLFENNGVYGRRYTLPLPGQGLDGQATSLFSGALKTLINRYHSQLLSAEKVTSIISCSLKLIPTLIFFWKTVTKFLHRSSSHPRPDPIPCASIADFFAILFTNKVSSLRFSFIHSRHFYSAPSSPLLLRGRSRLQHGYYIGVSCRSAQATVGKGLAQGPYVTAIERESNPRPSGWK